MTDPALPIATTFIAAREAFVSAPYQDIGGVWTCGYGFTTQPDGKPVTAGTPPVTQEDAYVRLETMAAAVLTKVRQMVYVPLSDNAAASLCSFAWNEGTGALRTSTLMDRLNAREPMAEVAACFASWVYAGGRYSQGLANRRAMEAALFLRADSETGIPVTEQNQPVAREAENQAALTADELDDLYN